MGHWSEADFTLTICHSVFILLLFVVPPRITRPPSDKTVTFGGNVTFTCRAYGVPEPQITWHNTLGIAADTDPRATVLPSGDLFMQSIEIKDAGRYECVAENSLGRDTAQVTLILTGLSKWHGSLCPLQIIDGFPGPDRKVVGMRS